MLSNLNPLSKSKTIPYHRISREFSENGSDQGQSSTDRPLAQKEHYSDEDAFLTAKALHRPRRAWLRHTFCYILVIVASMLTGWVIGEMFRVEYEIDGYLAPFGNPNRVLKDIVWHENKTFADEPSEITEKAWDRMIPEGRGFVKHPILTKGELMSVSVFHEIHCLHMIRTAYFTSDYLHRRLSHQISNQQTLSNSLSDQSSTTPSFTPNPYLEDTLAHPAQHGLDPDHVKHCFDYLRQALMCAADTNLEDTSVTDGREGAEGWGTKRVCRDFGRVRKWSKKWRTGNGVGIE